MSETIGERLRRLRQERGMSQRDLHSPGVSYAYISRIEAGARDPSVKALRKLAERLDVSVEYLESGRERTTTDDLFERLAEASENGAIVVTTTHEGGVMVRFVRNGADRNAVADSLTEALRSVSDWLAEVQAIERERQDLDARYAEVEQKGIEQS